MNIHTYTNILIRQYPGLKVFTKREMGRYSYFPAQLPDAFLSLPSDAAQPKRFFLDLVTDSVPPYQLDRRITNYCDFFDDGGWDISGTEIPTLLLIGEQAVTERRIRRIVSSVFRKTDSEELKLLTTTMTALKKSQESAIWSDIEDPDDIRSL